RLLLGERRFARCAEGQKRYIEEGAKGDQRIVDAYLLAGRPRIRHNAGHDQQPRTFTPNHGAIGVDVSRLVIPLPGIADARPKMSGGATSRIAACDMVMKLQAKSAATSAFSWSVRAACTVWRAMTINNSKAPTPSSPCSARRRVSSV